ncbi:MAG: hypothetical protein ACYC24_10360, partial [Desulfobacteria bacterium]
YPMDCSLDLIILTLGDAQFAASPAVLRGYVEYLHEKGYVEVQDVEAGGISRTMVRLTAHGKDLLEGNIPVDPGISIVLYGHGLGPGGD